MLRMRQVSIPIIIDNICTYGTRISEFLQKQNYACGWLYSGIIINKPLTVSDKNNESVHGEKQ